MFAEVRHQHFGVATHPLAGVQYCHFAPWHRVRIDGYYHLVHTHLTTIARDPFRANLKYHLSLSLSLKSEPNVVSGVGKPLFNDQRTGVVFKRKGAQAGYGFRIHPGLSESAAFGSLVAQIGAFCHGLQVKATSIVPTSFWWFQLVVREDASAKGDPARSKASTVEKNEDVRMIVPF
ncbi:hypothetical protein GGQ85_004145 [Nitrobacter vulgaris]|uniref:hypothetical protein n=1 Tax=Nitrobacter vulgaris TaxID=29421 RepID=UPI002860DEA6|nr:hypothetical protein [Nitrobacter vulgaris]MDR6306413.1 hypothetical protein [Nitrobacter vulgaris]